MGPNSQGSPKDSINGAPETQGKKVKRTCIAPSVKLQLKALRYGSHRVPPANYTIPASILRTFARWRHLNGIHLIQLATHLSTRKDERLSWPSWSLTTDENAA